jgi:hypothetical protein
MSSSVGVVHVEHLRVSYSSSGCVARIFSDIFVDHQFNDIVISLRCWH